MKTRLTHKRVRKAMVGTGGILLQVSKNLDVDRITLYRYLKKYPELKREVDDEIENVIDVAESHLAKALNLGERWAINKVLNRPAAIRRKDWKPPAQKIESEVKSFNMDVPFSDGDLDDLLEGVKEKSKGEKK